MQCEARAVCKRSYVYKAMSALESTSGAHFYRSVAPQITTMYDMTWLWYFNFWGVSNWLAKSGFLYIMKVLAQFASIKSICIGNGGGGGGGLQVRKFR